MLKQPLSKEFTHKFIRYVVIGLFTALVDFGSFVVLQSYMAVLVANTVAVILSVIFGFFGHKYYTFRNTEKHLPQFIKFSIMAVVNITLSNVLMYVFIFQLGIGNIVSKVLTIAIIVFESFAVNNFYIFKRRKADPPPTTETPQT